MIREKTTFFCRELANTRPTKELKAFFAFAESLPTSATLPCPSDRNLPIITFWDPNDSDIGPISESLSEDPKNSTKHFYLGKGSRKNTGKSLVFYQKNLGPPHLRFGLFYERKKSTQFFFWKWTIDAWHKFYTWYHLKIFIFASVVSVYICPK